MAEWSVPRLWQGETVAILASGPSMNQTAANKVRHLSCIAINTTFRLVPWADMIYAHDRQWWLHPENQAALEFAGLKVGGEPVPGVFILKNSGIIGFDPDPRFMRVGGNSGYQALHLAIQAGAARVLLLGFDMGGGHWHKPHPKPLGDASEAACTRWVARFATLLPAIAERGVEVINCTPNSRLTCFPMMTVEQALAARPGSTAAAA